MNDMRYLVEKYAGGYESYAREHGLQVSTAESDTSTRILADSQATQSNAEVAVIASA